MDGFVDVEEAICEILATLGKTVGTVTDANLEIPIRVNRAGGPTRPWEDNATVEVTCFCATRPESVTLNRQVVALLNDRRAVQTTLGLIDKISNFVAPFPAFDPNPDTRKVTSMWTVTSRLQELPT